MGNLLFYMNFTGLMYSTINYFQCVCERVCNNINKSLGIPISPSLITVHIYGSRMSHWGGGSFYSVRGEPYFLGLFCFNTKLVCNAQ